MNASPPALPSRAITTILAAVVLSLIALFLVRMNMGISISMTRGAGGVAGLHMQLERQNADARNARDLPMYAPASSTVALKAWARGEGRVQLRTATPLSPWEEVMLGRVLAVQPLVFDTAERLGLDALWFLQVLASESGLDPIAQGPEEGDRGLGQVSFASEHTGLAWAQDRANPYFTGVVDGTRSIWDPEQNVALAGIVLRSLYVSRDVRTNAQAYARYTHGLAALDGSRIADRTQPRIARATEYEPALRMYLSLAFVDDAGGTSLPTVATSGLVPQLLAIRGVDAGLPLYRALRDLYLSGSDEQYSQYPWALVLRMHEVLNYSELIERLTGEGSPAELAQVRASVQRQWPVIAVTADRELRAAAVEILARTDRMLGSTAAGEGAVSASRAPP